jgi:hypothetical protein
MNIENLALAVNFIHTQILDGEELDIDVLPFPLPDALKRASQLPNCLRLDNETVKLVFTPVNLAQARQKCQGCPLAPTNSNKMSDCVVYQARVDQAL